MYILYDVDVDNGYVTMGHLETIMLDIDWNKHMWLDPYNPRRECIYLKKFFSALDNFTCKY